MHNTIVVAAMVALVAVGVTGWANHSSREHLRGQRDAALAQAAAVQQSTSAFTQSTPKMPYASE